MVHLPPLPGGPFGRSADVPSIIAQAVSSAKALEAGGAQGCLIQTADRVHEVCDSADPARVAAVSLVVSAVVDAVGSEFAVGVQLMWNGACPSLAVAKVAGASFVRMNAFVGRSATPFGIAEGDPLQVMRYRDSIDAWDIGLVADVQTMHFRWWGDARSVAEVARCAAEAGADAVVVSDRDPVAAGSLIDAARAGAPDAPVLLGGGTTHGCAGELVSRSDGVFVGTCLQPDGWGGAIDEALVRSYCEEVARAC